MSDPASHKPGRTLVAWALLLVHGVLGQTVWLEEEFRPHWDASMYVLLAQSMDAGDGYTYAGEPFFLRPPGLAAFLSPWLGDPGDFDAELLNRWMMAFASLAVVAVYLGVARHIGRGPGIMIAWLVGTNPEFVGTFNFVLSEFPALALLLAGFALLRQMGESSPRWWGWALAGALCLIGSYWFRTVAMLAWPAVPFAAGRESFRRGLLPLGLVVLGALPWMWHSRQAMEEATLPGDQLLLATYGTALFHEDPGDPESPRVSLSGFAERVKRNGSAIAQGLARDLCGTSHVVATSLLVLLVLGGMALRWRRPSILDWFSLAYLGLLLTYFTYAPRLILPLLPILYLSLFPWMQLLAKIFAKQHSDRVSPAGHPSGRAQKVMTACLAALLLAQLVRLPTSLSGGFTVTQVARPASDIRKVADWIRDNTPSDAVILCAQAPLYRLLSQREVYTYRFPRRDILSKYRPDYLVFDVRTPQLRQGLERSASEVAPNKWILRDLEAAPVTIYELP